jgi:hypothetical protein
MLIGPFNIHHGIVIQGSPNGGFVVTLNSEMGCKPLLIGAYTNSADLLKALASALPTTAPDDGVQE